MRIHKPKLYSFILVLIFSVLVIALGGGIFNQNEAWSVQWQHRLFQGLCHQIPDRSFWIQGQPMAVCSRCFGIYFGFATGWVLMVPVMYIRKLMDISINKIILIAIAANAMDFTGNILGLWENTLISRWGLGTAIGWSSALLFINEFITVKS
jgi:uncharacterized membrane protein